MNKFTRYLKVQCMRATKHYPVILIFTILLTVSLGIFVVNFFQSKDGAESKKRFSIGLVGDLSESYLDIGILAITSVDSSQYYVEFVELEEEEAKSKLLSGELYGYIQIPDGFVKSIVYGENKPLTYVASNSPATFGPTLTNEVVQIISKLVIQGQNGIYGMIEIADIYNVKGKAYKNALNDLNMLYIDVVLDRENFYDVTYVGLGDGITFKEYYICAFLILLVLLWGISCSALLIKHDMALPRILQSNGYRLSHMVMGDYIPFGIMMCINTALMLGVGGRYLGIEGMEFFWNALPVIIMLTAMQFCLYELSSNMISGVLMQLFVTIILSYASGIFYPIYSLPSIIQNCSKVLPTRVAFNYLSEIIQGKSGWEMLTPVWIYTILFAILSIVIRRYKIRSNKYD